MVLVHAKQTHDKAGRAKPALRGMALHHGLLRRVKPAVVCSNVFHRPERHAINGMRQPNTAIDSPKTKAAVFSLTQHHRAGAAVALAAAFFGAGASQVFAQYL